MSLSNSLYIESRNGGYYIAGSSVSLASIVCSFQQGASPETILEEFPRIGSLAKIYGAITVFLENPSAIEKYMADQEGLWQELENKHPLPPEMLARYEEGRKLLKRRSA